MFSFCRQMITIVVTFIFAISIATASVFLVRLHYESVDDQGQGIALATSKDLNLKSGSATKP